eukprot:Sro1526_g279830.2  (413) ;mRNA; r:25634-26872
MHEELNQLFRLHFATIAEQSVSATHGPGSKVLEVERATHPTGKEAISVEQKVPDKTNDDDDETSEQGAATSPGPGDNTDKSDEETKLSEIEKPLDGDEDDMSEGEKATDTSVQGAPTSSGPQDNTNKSLDEANLSDEDDGEESPSFLLQEDVSVTEEQATHKDEEKEDGPIFLPFSSFDEEADDTSSTVFTVKRTHSIRLEIQGTAEADHFEPFLPEVQNQFYAWMRQCGEYVEGHFNIGGVTNQDNCVFVVCKLECDCQEGNMATKYEVTTKLNDFVSSKAFDTFIASALKDLVIGHHRAQGPTKEHGDDGGKQAFSGTPSEDSDSSGGSSEEEEEESCAGSQDNSSGSSEEESFATKEEESLAEEEQSRDNSHPINGSSEAAATGSEEPLAAVQAHQANEGNTAKSHHSQ